MIGCRSGLCSGLFHLSCVVNELRNLPEFCTWAHVEFEVLGDGADGSEVGGVIEMFLHRLRGDFTEFILHSFSNTHCVHGDTCTQGRKHHTLTFNVNINLQELESDRYSTIT